MENKNLVFNSVWSFVFNSLLPSFRQVHDSMLRKFLSFFRKTLFQEQFDSFVKGFLIQGILQRRKHMVARWHSVWRMWWVW